MESVYPELNPLPLKRRKPLSNEELKRKAYEELGEDQNTVQNEIDKFRKSVIDLGIPCRLDDMFMLVFLRCRKFDHPNALRVFGNLYKLWLKFGPRLVSKSLEDVKEMFNENMFFVLKRMDNQGRHIFIVSMEHWKVKYDFADFVTLPFMATLLLVETHEFQINGNVFIIDLKELSMKHVQKVIPHAFDILYGLQDALPIRYKEIHMINQNFLIDGPRKIFWPLLKQKFKRRFQFHGKDMSSLHQFIPAEYLPLEYGGTVPLKDMEKVQFSHKLPHFFFTL